MLYLYYALLNSLSIVWGGSKAQMFYLHKLLKKSDLFRLRIPIESVSAVFDLSYQLLTITFQFHYTNRKSLQSILPDLFLK